MTKATDCGVLWHEGMLARLYCGDAATVLATLPADSVQCVVTSPPYFGLRDYGDPHQIGLELTPTEYVCRLVAMFEQVRRVLCPDGVVWLNLGDTYSSGGRGGNPTPETSGLQGGQRSQQMSMIGRSRRVGMPPKNLIGIPWRVALALQDAGWYLRSDIIWAKPNPMPESVTDRPTRAHEYVFLLSREDRYYYDAAAIAEPASGTTREATASFRREQSKRAHIPGQRRGTHRPDRDPTLYAGATRNRRSVWTIAPAKSPLAHYAIMPSELARLCILASSRPGDLVLDPFAGTGTTLIVAQALGRPAVGVELNPAYCALAVRRIEAVPLPLPFDQI